MILPMKEMSGSVSTRCLARFACLMCLIPPAAAQRVVVRPRITGEVRQVDFRNFDYVAESACVQGVVRVRNGEYRDAGQDFTFRVLDVTYGDLTRDRAEEAVVRVSCFGPSPSSATEAFVYTMKGSSPVLIAKLDSGHRGYGGIKSVAARNGLLVVERFQSNDGSSAPRYIETETLRLRGGQLDQVGRTKRRRYRAG